MRTAFGQAMLATINGEPQSFRMSMNGGASIQMNCQDFLEVRAEERQLLESIGVPDKGTVLDWGCGAGRHLLELRNRYPEVTCCGIEICDLLRAYCMRTIGRPFEFVATFDEVQNREFDLIMLMGNGLGVLGSEADARSTLNLLVQRLRSGGHIIVESGNPFGQGYFDAQFEIDWNGQRDGPFTWGYSDCSWIKKVMDDSGCATVSIHSSEAPGGMFFFAIGRKG